MHKAWMLLVALAAAGCVGEADVAPDEAEAPPKTPQPQPGASETATGATTEGSAGQGSEEEDPDQIAPGRVEEGQDESAWLAGVNAASTPVEIMGTPGPVVEVADTATGIVVEMTWGAGPGSERLQLALGDASDGRTLHAVEGTSPLRLVVEDLPAGAYRLAPHAPENGAFVDASTDIRWAIFHDMPVDPEHAF